MATSNQIDKNSFIYQYHRYQGDFTPEHVVFNSNLQEFAQRVGYICNTQTRGKITPQEAHKQIEKLWEELTQSLQSLGIEQDATTK